MSLQVKEEKGDRGNGFYCDVCDCTLKDSLNYLDHVRGKRHNKNIGISLKNFTDSTLDEVKQMLEFKKRERDRQSQDEEPEDEDDEHEVDEDEKYRKMKREKKKRQRARKSGHYNYDDGGDNEDDDDDGDDTYRIEGGVNDPNNESDAMARLMGFSSFSSTKD